MSKGKKDAKDKKDKKGKKDAKGKKDDKGKKGKKDVNVQKKGKEESIPQTPSSSIWSDVEPAPVRSLNASGEGALAPAVESVEVEVQSVEVEAESGDESAPSQWSPAPAWSPLAEHSTVTAAH